MLTTSPEARRGRSLVERVGVRVPGVAHWLSRMVFSLPPGSPIRARLLRWGMSRTFTAFTRRDWEVNTLLFDDDRYEFRAGDLARLMPGMREAYGGRAGYLEAMELFLDSFSELCVHVEGLVDVTGARVVPIIRFVGKGRASGAPVDQPAASVIDMRDGRAVRQIYWWDVEKAVAQARETLGDAQG